MTTAQTESYANSLLEYIRKVSSSEAVVTMTQLSNRFPEEDCKKLVAFLREKGLLKISLKMVVELK